MGAGNFLLLNDGLSTLELNGGGSLLLDDQTVTEPIVIIADNESIASLSVEEETTGLWTASLIDENGLQVALSEIETVVLHVIVPGATSDTSIRHEECLNQNDVTIAEGSTVTTISWLYQLEDTQLIDRTLSTEKHRATFEFGHNSASSGSGTDLITTTLDSSSVSVNIASHGLTIGSTGHHVFLNADDDVGGLTFKGAYRITSVDDADNVTIDALCDATGNAGPLGGTVEWWLNGKSNKHVVNLNVRRNDKVCA